MAILADDLIEGMKARISFPESQVLLDDDDFLRMADDTIRTKIIPLFESTNEDYFVTSVDVPLVANTSEYDIPYRAIIRGLREIKIRTTSDSTNVRNLAKIEIEDIPLFLNSSFCEAFYFKGDRLVLVPSVGSNPADTLEMWYQLLISKLTAVANVATVVSKTTTVVTVDAVPSTFTTSTPLDFIQAKSGNRIYTMDKTPTVVGPTSLTFATGDIPTTLVAGDYIALAGYSPVVNLVPDTAKPYLETCLAKRVLKAAGDYEGARELDDDIKEEKDALLKILEPRIDGEPTVIINRYGLVRGNKFGQRRWLYGQ